jgi:hypothetical protein
MTFNSVHCALLYSSSADKFVPNFELILLCERSRIDSLQMQYSAALGDQHSVRARAFECPAGRGHKKGIWKSLTCNKANLDPCYRAFIGASCCRALPSNRREKSERAARWDKGLGLVIFLSILFSSFNMICSFCHSVCTSLLSLICSGGSGCETLQRGAYWEVR